MTSCAIQREEEDPSFKKPRPESEDDVISQEKTHQSSSIVNHTHILNDHAHSSQEDPLLPPYNTSNQQLLKKSKLGLDVCYYPTFLKVSHAKAIFNQLEKELSPYFNISRNEVIIMGKVHKIPRKQAAFGDPELVYKFSGVSIPANPWIPVLESLRDLLTCVLGERFNFVLVNRYKDGHDHMGEHRDDEIDLAPKSPIAALSLGQRRDFVFKHRDTRGSKGTRKNIDPIKVCLEHGSLLVMYFPTNKYWYHSLPVRKSILGTRISLTYRIMRT